jgi:hypothetical protein
MFTRNKQGERRLSSPAHKLLLTAHIVASGGWLGVFVAKLVLGIAAVAANDPAVANARYDAMNALSPAFPLTAISTIVTGVLLSLGTKWGLLRHYWVATKLVLTFGVIGSALNVGDQLVADLIATSSGQTADAGSILGGALPSTTLLIALLVTHMLMLGAATVISVYKPWGKTWFGLRAAAQSLKRGAQDGDRRSSTDGTANAAPLSASQ